MKWSSVWTLKSTDENKNPVPVKALALKPDGTKLIVGQGRRMLCFQLTENPTQHMYAHDRTVVAITWSPCLENCFASGSVDGVVVLWEEQKKPKRGFRHESGVQVMNFHPTEPILASASSTELGIWSLDMELVNKHRVFSPILSMSWSPDGKHLAVGHFNGIVSVRDKSGVEHCEIHRDFPIWCLGWKMEGEKGSFQRSSVLIAGWDMTVATYYTNGSKSTEDSALNYYPTSCVSFPDSSGEGTFLCVAGSGRNISLIYHGKDEHGMNHTYHEDMTTGQQRDWVWAMSAGRCPTDDKSMYVVFGTEDGDVVLYKVGMANDAASPAQSAKSWYDLLNISNSYYSSVCWGLDTVRVFGLVLFAFCVGLCILSIIRGCRY